MKFCLSEPSKKKNPQRYNQRLLSPWDASYEHDWWQDRILHVWQTELKPVWIWYLDMSSSPSSSPDNRAILHAVPVWPASNINRCPQVSQHKLDLRLAIECFFTCMRFMASRIWSRWWAELSASRRMSVNFSSFSLSSFFSWRTISASASVHSHSLQPGLHTGRRRGSPRGLYHTHTIWRENYTLGGNKRA